MSCRTTPAGSAFTTFSRLEHGSTVSDVQCLSLFHSLRREYDASSMPQLGRDEYIAAVEDRRRAVMQSRTLTPARRVSVLSRLDAALTAETPDASTIYALQRLDRRVSSASHSIGGYIRTIAPRLGMTEEQVRERWDELQDQIDRSRTAGAPETFTDVNRRRAADTGLPTDHGTVHAVAVLEEQARRIEADRALEAEQRIVPTELLNQNSGIPGVRVTHLGFDQRIGRAEITIIDNDGRSQRLAYRNIDEATRQAWGSSAHPGEYWRDNIRGNPAYAYSDQIEADLESAAPRCGTCGQFANAAHSCPVQSEPRLLSRWRCSSRWSRQSVNLTQRLSDGTEHTVEQRISLPAIREFRDAFEAGPVKVDNIYEYISVFNPEINRHQYVHITGGVTVWKDTEGVMQFNTSALRCNCQQYREHNTCPHVATYLNAIRTRLVPPPRPRSVRTARTPEEREAILREQQRLAEEAARTDWTRQQETLEEARRTWRTDSEVIYSEDPDAFRADFDAAVEATAAKNGIPAIPYMRENVLDGLAQRGSGQAFGMEIEYEFPPTVNAREANQAIGRELFAAGLTFADTQQGYHAGAQRGFRDTHTDENGVGNWSWERDGSVNGGELVSPAMYDEPETWEKLEKAVEILRRHGAIATPRAGAHVHVGVGQMKENPAAHAELARLVTQHEDVMFRLASNPERGTHRLGHYTVPNNQVPPTGFQDIQSISRWQGGRARALNYGGVSGSDKDHVEFRIFDSTLDPGAMQAQIKLAVAMTAAAQRQASAGGTARGKEELGAHAARAKSRGRRRITDEEFVAESATTRSLLDTLFKRREDKAQLVAVFANTKWNKPRGGRR